MNRGTLGPMLRRAPCAAAPPRSLGANGDIYATTFEGLRVSRDGGPGYLAGVWVDAIDTGPDGSV